MDPNKMDARTVGDTNSQYNIISIANKSKKTKYQSEYKYDRFKNKENSMSELSMSKIKPVNNML